MPNRWMQFAMILVFGLTACALDLPPTTGPAKENGPTTRPAVVPPQSPATEKHEPVAPPPLPPPPAAPVIVPSHPASQPVTAPPPAPIQIAATQPGPIDDKVAYALGFSVARRVRDQLAEGGRSADKLQVLKGMLDGMTDHDPAYSRADVQQAFADFQAYTLQRRAEKLYADEASFRKRADDNEKMSRALLDQNAKMAGVDVRPDGVQIQELTPGNGRVVGMAHSITVKNLRVSLADGTLVKSSDANATEKLNMPDVLAAFADTVRTFKVGGKYRVWLPPEKAFGLTGKAPVIGANQAIEYEFELLSTE